MANLKHYQTSFPSQEVKDRFVEKYFCNLPFSILCQNLCEFEQLVLTSRNIRISTEFSGIDHAHLPCSDILGHDRNSSVDSVCLLLTKRHVLKMEILKKYESSQQNKS